MGSRCAPINSAPPDTPAQGLGSPKPETKAIATEELPEHGDVFSPQELCSRSAWTWGSLPKVVRRMSNLSLGAKVMYAALAEFEATVDRVFPSIKRLGEETGVSPVQARRYIRELEDAKLLKVSRRMVEGKQGLHDSSVYEFLYHPEFDDFMKETRTPKSESTPNCASTSESDSTAGLESTPEDVSTRKDERGVLPDMRGGYSQIRESNKITYKHQLTTPLHEAAERIHKTHPAVRRDLSLVKIEERLKLIAKRKKKRGDQASAYFAEIANYHEQLCQSEQWRKEDGQFAKGLSNWLAPAMDRYEPTPSDPNGEAPEKPPPKLPMGASKYDNYDPNADYEAYCKNAGLSGG